MAIQGHQFGCLLLVIVSLTVASPVLASETTRQVSNVPEFGSASDFFRNIHVRCTNTGNVAAMNNITDAVVEAVGCFHTNANINTTEMAVAMTMPNPEEFLGPIIKKYCGWKSSIIRCSDIIFNAVKVCFTTNEVRVIDRFRNIRDLLLQILCYHDTSTNTTFLNHDVVQCVVNKSEDLAGCFVMTLQEVEHQLHDGADIIDISSLFSAANCRKFSSFRSCVARTTKQCPNPKVAIIIDSLLLATAKVTPCGRKDDLLVDKALSLLDKLVSVAGSVLMTLKAVSPCIASDDPTRAEFLPLALQLANTTQSVKAMKTDSPFASSRHIMVDRFLSAAMKLAETNKSAQAMKHASPAALIETVMVDHFLHHSLILANVTQAVMLPLSNLTLCPTSSSSAMLTLPSLFLTSIVTIFSGRFFW